VNHIIHFQYFSPRKNAGHDRLYTYINRRIFQKIQQHNSTSVNNSGVSGKNNANVDNKAIPTVIRSIHYDNAMQNNHG
jgi:hypothetical protein